VSDADDVDDAADALLASLHVHLERHHIEYLQFAFRWMNNLLMREMPLHCVIRLWDTYLVSRCWCITKSIELMYPHELFLRTWYNLVWRTFLFVTACLQYSISVQSYAVCC